MMRKKETHVIFNYKGYEIVTMPLPSSGGMMLPQMMKMVEDQPLHGMGFSAGRQCN